MKIRPLADRVVIKRAEAEEKTASGIILAGAAKEQPQIAEVIEVGPGNENKTISRQSSNKKSRGRRKNCKRNNTCRCSKRTASDS